MSRLTVILQEQVASDAVPIGAQIFHPTLQQRTSQRCRVAEIRFIDGGALPGVPAGAGACSVSVYRAVTPRLIRTPVASGRRANYYFLSFVNGLPGREAEYDKWYLERHIHEVLAAPDFVAAQRFTLERTVTQELFHPFRYLAVYELCSDDLTRSIASLESYLVSGVMTETALKDPTRRLQVFVQPAETF